ncbi:MAG: S1 RNA-binding domain-containing protein [Leptospiraceae bacterium]|nr:S1 RNA-binding domain-containing protein [Leptospiraceae bacterium]MCP5496012.1 S1 RNA-binding domain-containing protein [Leptospiraceae bacterium]
MTGKEKSNKFASLLEESFKKRKKIETGASYDSIVTSVKNDYVFILTIQDKISGIISVEEFEDAIPSKNDKLLVYFLYENHGDYYFTTCISDKNISEDNIETAYHKEIPVYGAVVQEINGGYEVKVGEFTGFCPYSQIDHELKQEKIIGKEMKFIIHEIRGNKLVLSQKKISDKEKELKKEILKAELKEGAYVTCKIKSIQNYGIKVEMNGVDALIPNNEATYKRKFDLNSEFHIGQVLHAKILTMNWEENRFILSIKDFIEDPWAKSVPFKEGDIISGTVDMVKPYGIFMKLSDTFSALVPQKETGLDPRTPLVGHFKVGDSYDIFIMEVNPEKRQISASIQKALDSKEKMEYQQYINNNNQGSSSGSTSSFGLLLKKSLENK